MKRISLRRTVLGAVLLSSACQDLPSGPHAGSSRSVEPAGAATGRATAHPGLVAFRCVVSLAAPEGQSGFLSLRKTIYFPRAEVDPGGRTIPYVYAEASQTEWFSGATCTIPRTQAAIRRMDRTFQVDRDGAVRTERRHRPGEISLMGCVQDGMCTLEGITVTAPERTSQNRSAYQLVGDDPEDTGTPYDGWDYSGGTFIGGETEETWVSDGDTDGDGDYLDEGPIAFGMCVAGRLGPGGWGAIGGTALAAWELWGAYTDSRNALNEWQEYDRLYSQEGYATGWTQSTSDLYQKRYQDAESSKESLLKALAIGSGVAAWEIGKAAIACAPAAAAPV